MLKIHTKRHIRFATLDKGNVFVVVAVLLETTGTETVAISEPRVVKIIPKAQYTLPGTISYSRALNASTKVIAAIKGSIISPYISHIFGSEKSNFITGLAAQPPTF